MAKAFRPSLSELLVHRCVAFLAKRGLVEALVPRMETGPDPEEQDDKLDDDSVETSEIIDSGDDAEDVERARDDLRTTVGYPSNVLAFWQNASDGRRSRVDRAMHTFCTCDIAAQMEARRAQKVLPLAAGAVATTV